MKLLQPFIIIAGLLFGALPECLYCVINRIIEWGKEYNREKTSSL
jgi:hypothetical protein